MRILGVIVVIVAAAIAAAIFYVDTIAKAGIERGTEYAAGVPTSLDSARIGLVSGRFRVSGLEIGNPPGYQSPHFLALGRAELRVPVTNLLENTIKVPLVELDGIDVYLEKDRGKGNYDAILANLERLGGGTSAAPAGKKTPAEAAPSGKTFVIESLVIRNVAAHLRMPSLPVSQGKVDVTIPEIRLRDVGTKDGNGVAISELTSIVTNAILTAVMRNGVNLPGAIVGDLRQGLGRLGKLDIESTRGLTEVGGKVLGDVVEGIKGGGKPIGDAAGGVGEKLKEGLGGLGGLLGGSKKEE
jgi:hypothetical protein